MNNPFNILGDFLKVITGQPLSSPTSTVGGGTNNSSKMPWYVIALLVVVGGILLVMLGNKLMKKAGLK